MMKMKNQRKDQRTSPVPKSAASMLHAFLCVSVCVFGVFGVWSVIVVCAGRSAVGSRHDRTMTDGAVAPPSNTETRMPSGSVPQ